MTLTWILPKCLSALQHYLCFITWPVVYLMHILKWCMSIFFFCRLVELGKVWNNKCSGEIQVKCRTTGEGYHHRWGDASPGPQFSLLLGVIAQCGTPDCLLLCCHQANPGLPRLSELGSFLHWSAHGSQCQQALRAPADGIHSIFLLFIFNEWCQKLWSDIC